MDDGPSGCWNWQCRGKFGWIPRNRVNFFLKHQYWYTLCFSIWSKLLTVVWGPIWRGNMKHRSRINCGTWEKKYLCLKSSCIDCNSQWDITISLSLIWEIWLAFFLQLSYSHPLIENAYACHCILFSSIRYGVIDEVGSSHTVIGYAICLNKGFQESLTEFFLLSQLCTFSHLQEINCFHSCMIFSLTSVQSQRKWTFCTVCYGVESNILQKIRLKP